MLHNQTNTKMKKIFLFAALCMAGFAASAQYFSTVAGTKAEYVTKIIEANTEVNSTETVTSVTTDADNIVKATVTSESSVPGSDFAKVSFETTNTYNPATKVTTITEMDAATFKKFVTDMVIQAAEAQGHMVSDSDRAELDKNLNPKGALSLEINPEAAEGTVQKDCTLSMSMGQQRMLMKWGKITFAGFEEVTVPAGTFNCAKFTYVLTESMGEAPSKQYITAWYAEGVGLIKEQQADKKGKVSETKELTALIPAVAE